MAQRSKAPSCCRSPAEIVGLNPIGVMHVCRVCCMLSGRGLCDGLITSPEESNRPLIKCVRYVVASQTTTRSKFGTARLFCVPSASCFGPCGSLSTFSVRSNKSSWTIWYMIVHSVLRASRVGLSASCYLSHFEEKYCINTMSDYRPFVSIRVMWPFTFWELFMYRQFSIQQFYVLPTQCIIYVFCVDLRTNSGYFPIQH